MYTFEDIPNLHTHTLLCKHAYGNPAEYCAVAEKYSNIIGFSDHCPFPDDRYSKERMSFFELQEYYELVEFARKKFPALTVLFGAEVEWCSDLGRNYYIDTLLGERKMDYLVGSAHYSGFSIGNQEHFYYYSPSPQILRDFVDVTLKLIESGIFSFIAHPDAFMIPYKDVTKEHELLFREIIEAAAGSNTPIELNATGIRGKRAYPCRRFWEIASEYPTLEVVVNSDAHKPEHLFDNAVQTALDTSNELKLNISNMKVANQIIRGNKK